MIVTRVTVGALLAFGYLVLTAAAADDKPKKLDANVIPVTAKEITEEFAKRGAAATKKYNPAPAKGKPARIDIDGVVKEVNEDKGTVVLDGFNPKVFVVLKTKKINGDKEGKRVAIAKGGSFVEFKDKKNVVIEVDEVKLEKIQDNK